MDRTIDASATPCADIDDDLDPWQIGWLAFV
jgi:hypothetical protein